jgi:hypothetical protein
LYFAQINNISIKTWCGVVIKALRSGAPITLQLESIYKNFYGLADLEETHSVTNDSDEERYVLKIPTPESFYNIAAKLKDLYNG